MFIRAAQCIAMLKRQGYRHAVQCIDRTLGFTLDDSLLLKVCNVHLTLEIFWYSHMRPRLLLLGVARHQVDQIMPHAMTVVRDKAGLPVKESCQIKGF